MKRGLRKTYMVVMVIYLALLLLLFVLPFFIPSMEMKGIFHTLLSLMLFPSLVLLPLSLFMREWKLTLPLIPAVIGWIVIYGSLLLPRTITAPDDGKTFNVLTFNLQAEKNQLDILVDIIRESGADIVGIQELSHEAADYFEQRLRDTYPYMALYPQDKAFDGQGVLSRYSIIDRDYWAQPNLEATLGNMWARIDLEGQIIKFYNVHPYPPISFEMYLQVQSHSKSIDDLLTRTDKEQEPLVLVGDFNMTQLFYEYHRVTSRYVDAFREAGRPGFGFTFPNKRVPFLPLLRLDYVFHDQRFTSLDAYPLDRSDGSDHLPVFARLALKPDE
jgi:endonuclease/exonuclease/phosphatase (EEP) superfamily protein YafD